MNKLLAMVSTAPSIVFSPLMVIAIAISVPANLYAAVQEEQPASESAGLPEKVADEASPDNASIAADFGLRGMVKLGHFCPVRIRIPANLAERAKWVEVETVDGDGVTVRYHQDIGPPDRTAAPTDQDAPAAQATVTVLMTVRIGRKEAIPVVRLLDANQREIARSSTAASAIQWYDAGQPCVAAIGDAMGLEQLVRTNRTDGTRSFVLVELDQSAQLPIDWRGYSACDCLVLAIRGDSLLPSITPAQWRAIDDYVRRGGACVISMGEIPENLMTDQRYSVLRSLIPGTPIDTGLVRDPGLLETLVSTDQPIAPFETVILESSHGQVEMNLTDTLSRIAPWWIQSAHGAGTIQFVASDLGSGALFEWKDQRLIWELLLESYLDMAGSEQPLEARGDSNYLGYNDLVGQLRATLDRFAGVRVITLGQMTALLALILLLIGPVDYFVSVRWLQRPHLSWYFSGAVLLASSLGLVAFYRHIRPDEIRINTVQVLDIDQRTGRLDGRLWSHVYTGRAHLLKVSPAGRAAQELRLDWQGLPGTGMGGLDSSLTTEHGMPPYRIEQLGNRTTIQGMGVSAAGTKAIAGSWISRIELQGESSLSELSGVDQVTGTLVNPLDVDLHDAVMFYHNWFYRLNSRIPAGSATTIGLDNIPRDIARKLNDRRSVQQSELAVKWDPSDRDSVDRLLELMMFHRAASGSNYTSLRHRYELHMDLSNLLETDRAILLGRIERPEAAVQIECVDGTNLQAVQELDRVWCRIIIPVRAASQARR